MTCDCCEHEKEEKERLKEEAKEKKRLEKFQKKFPEEYEELEEKRKKLRSVRVDLGVLRALAIRLAKRIHKGEEIDGDDLFKMIGDVADKAGAYAPCNSCKGCGELYKEGERPEGCTYCDYCGKACATFSPADIPDAVTEYQEIDEQLRRLHLKK